MYFKQFTFLFPGKFARINKTTNAKNMKKHAQEAEDEKLKKPKKLKKSKLNNMTKANNTKKATKYNKQHNHEYAEQEDEAI